MTMNVVHIFVVMFEKKAACILENLGKSLIKVKIKN
jgi:hypothetical protein